VPQKNAEEVVVLLILVLVHCVLKSVLIPVLKEGWVSTGQSSREEHRTAQSWSVVEGVLLVRVLVFRVLIQPVLKMMAGVREAQQLQEEAGCSCDALPRPGNSSTAESGWKEGEGKEAHQSSSGGHHWSQAQWAGEDLH
jgi:hypothetical protein